MKEAPLFIHAYDLHSWLLDRFAGERAGGEVARAVLCHSRALLETLSLALSRFDTRERLVEADEHATLLRVHLRLASEKGLLEDRQLFHAVQQIRDVGRQIGGWRKKLEAVE